MKKTTIKRRKRVPAANLHPQRSGASSSKASAAGSGGEEDELSLDPIATFGHGKGPRASFPLSAAANAVAAAKEHGRLPANARRRSFDSAMDVQDRDKEAAMALIEVGGRISDWNDNLPNGGLASLQGISPEALSAAAAAAASAAAANASAHPSPRNAKRQRVAGSGERAPRGSAKDRVKAAAISRSVSQPASPRFLSRESTEAIPDRTLEDARASLVQHAAMHPHHHHHRESGPVC